MSPRSLALAAVALVAPALASVPAASAQQSTFGLKAGLNVATLTGDNTDDLDPRLGFAGGAFVEIPVTPSFSVQPEVLYTQKGARETDGTTDATIALDYLEVPVLFKYTVPVTRSGLLLGGYVGPALAFKLNENVEADFGGTTVSEDTDFAKSTDVGVAFGATVGAGPFAVDGRYTLGLTNVVDSDVSDDDARNGVFTISALYRFGR